MHSKCQFFYFKNCILSKKCLIYDMIIVHCNKKYLDNTRKYFVT